MKGRERGRGRWFKNGGVGATAVVGQQCVRVWAGRLAGALWGPFLPI